MRILVAMIAAMLGGAASAAPLEVVATFSILGDMVRQVGGERVRVTTLVGPEGDAHTFQPAPADAQAIAGADLLVANGLDFEGWIDRLIEASGYDGPVARVAEGVETLVGADGEHADDPGPEHQPHAHGAVDPHAWQSLTAAQRYVDAIAAALAAADPDGAAAYRARADAYKAEIAALEAELRAALARLPEERRALVTNHDAFGYFEHEYGVRFVAPIGVSAEAEPSARDVAAIIRFIRERGLHTVFLENVSDARLLEQIAAETGATIGGTLYSDALSAPDGPAPTYLDMMRHNIDALTTALGN